MKNFAILTVAYIENQNMMNMANRAWESFPKGVDIVIVENLAPRGGYSERIVKSTWIKNDENCLARAWNIGLKKIFEKYDYALVSGLDSMSPPLEQIEQLVKLCEKYGFVAGIPLGTVGGEDMKHGDGSFSFYCISKECFKKVGDFNENYKPAYFEDNDYLERLWKNGYTPKRSDQVIYYHLGQGTVKLSPTINKQYAEFMNRNLQLFKRTYGKVPDHLPPNIIFGQ